MEISLRFLALYAPGSRSSPCLFLGDFNVVLGAHERARRSPLEFHAKIEDYNLMDISAKGIVLYIWSNGRDYKRHIK